MQVAENPETILCEADRDTDCFTRFYHNYKIRKASDPNAVRQYYTHAVPEVIEVSDHIYVDMDFCTWLRMEIAVNRYSSCSPTATER